MSGRFGIQKFKKKQTKKLPVQSFLRRSCGLLSNQPDPRTQPRSMDPDHMANRVPNRLCHLACWIKNKRVGWSTFSRRPRSRWKTSTTETTRGFFNSKICVKKINQLHSIPNTFSSPATLFVESEGQRFLREATTKRQRAITEQPGANAALLMKVQFPMPQVTAQRDYICETITLSQSKEAAFKWTVMALGGA